MKTLIIHLSDLHLGKYSEEHKIDNSNIDISKFLLIFKNDKNKYDNCFIVFSGDCTSSSKKRDFEDFDSLIQKIKNELYNLLLIDIKILIVPGNHDIDLKSASTPRIEQIQSKYKSNSKISQLYLESLHGMQNAIDYCKSYGIDFDNKSIVYKTYDLKANSRINFVLVNSAPFSCKNHVDKDVHYLMSSQRQIHGNPRKGYNSIEIIVSHHSPEWFEENSKQGLDNYIDEVASMCLFGHEHNIKSVVEMDESGNVVKSKAGELDIEDNQLTGSFTKIIIDHDNNLCTAILYEFSSLDNSYINKINLDKFSLKVNNCFSFDLNYYTKNINPYIIENLREKDVFIFPTLNANGSQQNIDSFDQLCNFINNEKCLILSGHSNIGKTNILHRIMEEYARDKWKILYDCSYYGSNRKSYENNIKSIFKETYKYSNKFYNDFVAETIENKIILIDNLESIKISEDRKNLIRYCQDNFGYIIISVTDVDMKRLQHSIADIYNSDISFSVVGFSIKKRFDLCKKICTIKNITNENDINTIKNLVEASIKTCRIIDMSDPYYLCLLVNNVIDNRVFYERDTTDAFSIIFSYSIEEAIVKASTKEILPNMISVLSKLCFDMVFNKKTIYFNYNDLKDAIDDRNYKFRNITIDCFSALEILRNSKLVLCYGDEYKFQRNSIVAYFASKEVIRLFNKKDEKYLKELTENISFGINGDVLLFVAYELKNIKLFFDIQDYLYDLLKDFDEISFSVKNNAILRSNKVLLPETSAQAENKKTFYNRIDDKEKKQIVKADEKENNVYTYNNDEKANEILKIFKMLELSCKAISGFEEAIEYPDRETLLAFTLSAALKLVNLIFSFSQEDIDELTNDFNEWKEKKISDLKSRKISDDKIKKIQSIDLVHIIYDYLTTWILNMESGMASIMVSKTSLPLINNLDDKNFCYQIFKLHAYLHFGETDLFVSYLDNIYKKNNIELSYILNRIVRVFVIINSNKINHVIIDKLSSITGISQVNIRKWIE